MFQLWKPGRQAAESYHLARAYEERVRAHLTQSGAARIAHLKLSDLHQAASQAEHAKRASEPRRPMAAIQLAEVPACTAEQPGKLSFAHYDNVIQLRPRGR